MLEQPFEAKFRKINLSNSKILSIIKNNMKILNIFKEFQFLLFNTESTNNKLGMEKYINKAFISDKGNNYYLN